MTRYAHYVFESGGSRGVSGEGELLDPPHPSLCLNYIIFITETSPCAIGSFRKLLL